jgi:cytochrome c553
VALDAMMILGASDDTSPEARAYILDQLAKLGESLRTRKDENPLADAHYRQAERDIAHYLENPKERAPKSAMPAWGGRPRSRYPLPPGPPLG